MDNKSHRQLINAAYSVLLEDKHTGEKKRGEIKVGYYQTSFFHMCPGAIAAFPDIEEEIGGGPAATLAAMADQIFEIESEVKENGPSRENTEKAEELFNELMAAGNKMGVTDKLDYMEGHMEIIKGEEEDDNNDGVPDDKDDDQGQVDSPIDTLLMSSNNGFNESYIMERQRYIQSVLIGEKLDPVGREDGDIDNDGDEDETDSYLMNRRKAIGKAIKKKKKLLNPVKEDMHRHPFDAESGPGEFDLASVHDHIEDHGGIPITPDNIEKHDIHFMDNKFDDRQEIFVDAGKGPLKGTATQMHVFRTPSGQEIHGMFPQPRQIGGSAYEQHPQFPGRRVYTSGIGDVIDRHDIPERKMFENYLPKTRSRGHSRREITEATVSRIDEIKKRNSSFSGGHPGIGRVR